MENLSWKTPKSASKQKSEKHHSGSLLKHLGKILLSFPKTISIM
jgi:hypothetical protein